MARRKQSVLALSPLVLLVGAVVGLLADEERGIGLAVVGIGLGGVLLGLMAGKPERAFGLTERMLNLLPETAWRVVMTILGVAIVCLGLTAFF